jgi:myo-inositol-1-phosphate synthase
MGTIPLGKAHRGTLPAYRNFAPLADLNDLVFTGWDIFGGNLYTAVICAARPITPRKGQNQRD